MKWVAHKAIECRMCGKFPPVRISPAMVVQLGILASEGYLGEVISVRCRRCGTKTVAKLEDFVNADDESEPI